MAYTYFMWFLFCQFLVFVSAIQTKFPAVIVFGDSSVDAGNNNFIPTVARSNFQPYGRDFKGGRATGRFSNGRIATDFISLALGVKPTIPAYLDPAYNISDFATGVTFASAATGYDNATSDVLVSVEPIIITILLYTNKVLVNYHSQFVHIDLYSILSLLGSYFVSFGLVPFDKLVNIRLDLFMQGLNAFRSNVQH